MSWLKKADLKPRLAKGGPSEGDMSCRGGQGDRVTGGQGDRVTTIGSPYLKAILKSSDCVLVIYPGHI